MTEYKTKVLFMHKSSDEKGGKNLFIFNDKEQTLGVNVRSLLMNTSDVFELIHNSTKLPDGKSRYAKVSVMEE